MAEGELPEIFVDANHSKTIARNLVQFTEREALWTICRDRGAEHTDRPRADHLRSEKIGLFKFNLNERAPSLCVLLPKRSHPARTAIHDSATGTVTDCFRGMGRVIDSR